MGTTVITIRLDNSGSGLQLDDGQSQGPHIITRVKRRDVIKWKLIPNAGVDSLDEIQSKGFSVFEVRPSRQPDGSLTGTIADFPDGSEEDYGIRYSINNVSYVHDPKIQIHA